MRAGATRIFGVLFFLSGATGLVYELLWVRVLYQSFGSTIQSVTTVVAAYVGGLGLGAWWLGRIGDRHARPAALYGWLEIAIGAFGVLSPLVLAIVHRGYVALASGLPAGGEQSIALRFGLAALVLLIPTTLMGGTLPVLTRALARTERDRLRATLGRLYGLNTLGAVAGTALAGFFLIERIGIRASLWSTAAVNLAIGLGAIALAGNPALRAESALAPTPPARTPGEPGAPRWLIHACLVLLALTAFSSLLAEITWTRVLILIVGGSTYAFTLVLLVFLLGIGIGGALSGRPRGSVQRTAADAALAQGMAAAGCALVIYLLRWLPEYVVLLFRSPAMGVGARLALLGGAVVAVVLVPAIGMGMTFPLLTELVAPEGEARGRDVGYAYALNAAGSIAGAVLTGFVLVVTYGSQQTLRLGVVLSGAAAMFLAVGAATIGRASQRDRALRARVLAAAFFAGIGLATGVVAPPWDSRIADTGAAIYGRGLADPKERRAFMERRGARQLAFEEGRNATVSVWEAEVGRALKLNGKADASDRGDMDTQVMLGLAPLAAAPAATSALVIGYGSGVTARVMADAPGVERVRVIEIEPEVLAMSRFFAHVNGNVLARPTVSVAMDDARSALQIDPMRYDAIVSEPSNPWMAGVATLYTPEFFRIVRARLTDSGVFCQWVQTYQLPLGVVATIVANLRVVFPEVEVWFGSTGDLMLLGSAHPFRYESARLAQLFGPHGALGEVGREYLGVDVPEDYLGRRLLRADQTARLASRAAVVHDDDRPELEFVAARRFLDNLVVADIIDSLVAVGLGTPPDSAAFLRLARVLSKRSWDPSRLKYVEAARRIAPGDPFWTTQTAGMLLALGHPAFADSALPSLAARGNADALLLSGIAALRGNKIPRARTLLERARGAGADTALTLANLALAAARESTWVAALMYAREAVSAARSTLRHPYPRELRQALKIVAQAAAPQEALSLLATAVARRPNSAALHEYLAVAALRAGDCETGLRELLELAQFGFERADGPALVANCRQGQPSH